MYSSKAEKRVALAGASITAGATATFMIDRAGFDAVSLDVMATTVAVAANNFSVFKVTENDTPTIGTATGIPTLTGGTAAGNFTIPNADTVVSNIQYIQSLDIDCRARKRYLFISVSPQATQTIAMSARLRRAKQSPLTTTDQGTLLSVSG